MEVKKVNIGRKVLSLELCFLLVMCCAVPVFAGTSATGHGTAIDSGDYTAYPAAQENTMLGDGVAVGNGAIAGQSYIDGDGNRLGDIKDTAIGQGAIARDDIWNIGQATAIGQDAQATNMFSTAIGQGSRAQAEWSTATGQGSQAGGQFSTATGSNATAAGDGSIAIGGGREYAVGAPTNAAQAYNSGSIAIGQGSVSGVAGSSTIDNTTAIGTGAQAIGTQSTATGAKATAIGAYSTAYGQSAQSIAANSVALGANSIAERPNTVSIGSAGAERQITNVADGTFDTDAVNVRQLHRVGAMAAAMAGLSPLGYDAYNRFQMSVAGGHYEGQNAGAIGAVYYFNDSFMAKAGGGFSSGEKMYTIGLAWKLGPVTTKTVGVGAVEKLQAQVQELQAQIDQLKQLLLNK